jgi:hypothetical protein
MYRLETFLQYGDPTSANLIFIGLEEGTGGEPLHLCLKARFKLLTDDRFANHVQFINNKSICDGWFLSDSRCLDQAHNIIGGLPFVPLSEMPQDGEDILVMLMQARLHWLLRNNNRQQGYLNINNINFPYYVLHRSGVDSAMIDFYPYLKQTANDWPEIYKLNFENASEYYTYYDVFNEAVNNRYRIIKNLYESFPMSVSVSYAGYRDGVFLHEAFFSKLGFSFNSLQHTDEVHPAYAEYIKHDPKLTIRDFKIGQRTNNKGKIQKAVLTPFFGQGRLAYNDLDVISTWL